MDKKKRLGTDPFDESPLGSLIRDTRPKKTGKREDGETAEKTPVKPSKRENGKTGDGSREDGKTEKRESVETVGRENGKTGKIRKTTLLLDEDIYQAFKSYQTNRLIETGESVTFQDFTIEVLKDKLSEYLK